jgi:DNA-directed RNA polymerase specialized sigma24 family protein
LSVPEVAAALGRSVEAAESLLARGRLRFRQAYAEVSP